MFEILIIIGIVITVCGIIRIIIAPVNSVWDFIIQMWWLDILGDILSALIEALGSTFDD